MTLVVADFVMSLLLMLGYSACAVNAAAILRRSASETGMEGTTSDSISQVWTALIIGLGALQLTGVIGLFTDDLLAICIPAVVYCIIRIWTTNHHRAPLFSTLRPSTASGAHRAGSTQMRRVWPTAFRSLQWLAEPSVDALPLYEPHAPPPDYPVLPIPPAAPTREPRSILP
ncbi:hypothetical protein BT96DRAFT_121325 [Gymnopus androsaceus JB14]|uniref:Uncharacterized protein n=1 Tax=Gymnopus androsaceus JB14 TaxID=1447944 RepID=A0A6A4HDY6_9AGAR|nr:hypothetical protein BT96DRAFT_121325 [Gymnopus androsaceus JB14]